MFWRLFLKCFVKIAAPLGFLVALGYLVDGIPFYGLSGWTVRILAFSAPIAVVSGIYARMRILQGEYPNARPDASGASPVRKAPAGQPH